MIQLKPEIIHHNGKPQYAVIPYADFLTLQEQLEDTACLRLLRKAKESKSPTVSLSDLKSKLGLKPNRRKRQPKSST